MPTYRYIHDFSPGDSFLLIRDLTPLSYGTPDEAWFTVKSSITQNDAQAVLQMYITVSGVNGTINVYPDGSSQLQFAVTAGLTMNMLPNETYLYDIQIHSTFGELLTIETGKLFTSTTITQTY